MSLLNFEKKEPYEIGVSVVKDKRVIALEITVKPKPFMTRTNENGL